MQPITDPETLLNRLVAQHRETIAKQARRQHAERGRGAVVFNIRAPEAESEEEPLRYLTFSGDPDEIAESHLALLHRLVQSYDPNEEVVVAAELPDGRTVFDVYEIAS